MRLSYRSTNCSQLLEGDPGWLFHVKQYRPLQRLDDVDHCTRSMADLFWSLPGLR